MERLQRITLSHGFLVILVAMLAGFMLMFSLLGGLEVWPGHILPIPPTAPVKAGFAPIPAAP